jgi:hypothetical protein
MKKIVSRFVTRDVALVQRFSNCGARPPGGGLLVFRGGGVVYMRDIYFERSMGAT